MSIFPLLIQCHPLFLVLPVPRLQLADEETGSEHAQTLGQDVLGEDVDERWQEDEGHGGLVDEEEGDELGHGRLEDSLLLVLASFPHSTTSYVQSHHLLRANLGLLVLAGDEGGARQGGGADGHGRASSGGPGEGAEETGGVHDGLSGVLRVSALLWGSNWRG